MSLTVIEILGRSQQGRTEPYICRCDDGEIYFVKGKAATRRGLIAEWLCAELGSKLGLPIAPYAIASVPDELIAADVNGVYQDLGAGPTFASSRIGTTEFSRPQLVNVARTLRRDVLLFDWWIHNGDRNLTDIGGNPNLLWRPADVFSSDAADLFNDLSLRDQYRIRMTGALQYWPAICDTLPEEWNFIDAEQTIPTEFPFVAVRALLDRVSTDAFWQLPS